MKKQLDLGSGIAPRQQEGYEAFGVDIFDFSVTNVRVADLAIHPIPYGDSEFDLVTAYDFMEHVPAVLYLPAHGDDDFQGCPPVRRRNCMIELFNEIYRVLAPGGEFYFESPAYIPGQNSQAVWQDPTHIYFWTPEGLNYFSGNYYGHHDDYGHTSRFAKRQLTVCNGRIHVRLRAIKSLSRDAEYQLEYTVEQ